MCSYRNEKLKKYVERSNEKLLNSVGGEGILGSEKKKKGVLEVRNKNFMGKSLHIALEENVRSEEPRNF